MLLTDEQMQAVKNIELCQTGGDCKNCSVECFKIAKAQYKVIVKWLFEPCTEHLTFHGLKNVCFEKPNTSYSHRYLCPECMEGLRKEIL